MATQQWSFARARKRSLSAMESPDGETIDPTGAASYKLSRSALRERYGARAIDATAPHSAADTMGNVGIETDPGGMLSTQAGWDKWFKKPAPRPPATAPMPSVATLAPATAMNPADLAPFAEKPPGSPVEYVDHAQRATERWFNANGVPIPRTGPRNYGDRFTSRYGSGSVSSIGDFRSKLAGKYSPDYERKLRNLATTFDDEFDF